MAEKLAYLLGPVRQVDKIQRDVISEYKNKLIKKGYGVFDPMVNAPQENKTGYEIVMTELQYLQKMRKNKDEGKETEVAVFWTNTPPYSEGSRVDTGIVLGFGLKPKKIEDWGEGWDKFYSKARRTVSYMNQCIWPIGWTDIIWHQDMNGKQFEDERIFLGVILSYLSQNNGFIIENFNLIGEDVKEKSYPKVVAEIQNRQILGNPLW